MSWPPHLVVGGLLLHERQRPADLDASLLYVGQRVDSLATGCDGALRIAFVSPAADQVTSAGKGAKQIAEIQVQ
jgi:hypothetical protein